MIFDRFYPDYYIKSVYGMPLAEFQRQGIKALIFDIDNTLAPFDCRRPDENIIKLFSGLRSMGFKLCVLSNNNRRRVREFVRPLGAVAVFRAGKPGITRLKLALKRMGVKPEEAALIGDQAFTDVWCANRAGIISVLSAPVCNRDQLITAVKRGLEAFVMGFYFRRNGIKPYTAPKGRR